ncbi:hypothetical protein Mgra_00003773, partial [Meloidogyne graminicola]
MRNFLGDNNTMLINLEMLFPIQMRIDIFENKFKINLYRQILSSENNFNAIIGLKLSKLIEIGIKKIEVNKR